MPITLVYDTTNSPSGRCCAWTVPDGVCSVTFEIWGGGGGGGGGLTMCDCCARTQSGGGGGYSLKNVITTPGTVYTVCAGNGGQDINSQGYGAPVGYCCNGCTGGTSYVVGTGVPLSFCATGGTGGCSNFQINCYGHCGCNGALGGIGYNGDINESGMPGIKAGTAVHISASGSFTLGGTAGGPGGGVGGFNNGLNNYYGGGGRDANNQMDGKTPGGGGAGHGCYTGCTCCDRGSGKGGPGLVKITW